MIVWTLIALVVARWPDRLRFPRRKATPPSAVWIARLLLVCVNSGLPLGTALSRVADNVDDRNGELDRLVRRAALVGLERALLDVTESSLEPLAFSLAHAQVSGSSLTGVLSAFIERSRRDHLARSIANARRAGVLLVVPLALMLLPGFVLLVFGPFVLEQMEGLGLQ